MKLISAASADGRATGAAIEPECRARPGRVHVVQDGSAHQTQALLLTDTETANWVAATAAGDN